VVRRGAVRVVCNLAATVQSVPLGAAAGEILFASASELAAGTGSSVRLGPESVVVLRCGEAAGPGAGRPVPRIVG
jgi:hypothetical protein